VFFPHCGPDNRHIVLKCFESDLRYSYAVVQPITRTVRRWRTDRAPPLARVLVAVALRQAPEVVVVVAAEVVEEAAAVVLPRHAAEAAVGRAEEVAAAEAEPP
jgi:hypothetical protein